MAVLAEALSVIVPVRTLEERFGPALLVAVGPDDSLQAGPALHQAVLSDDPRALTNRSGMEAYELSCPNETFCRDEHLTRVGFMSPGEVGRFVDRITALTSLTFQDGEEFVDIAVVDQYEGPTAPCAWLEFEHRDGIGRCWLSGASAGDLAVPAGWSPSPMTFIPTENLGGFEALAPEEGGGRVRDRDTGEIHYTSLDAASEVETDGIIAEAREYERAGQIAEAMSRYEAALVRRPGSAELSYCVGVMCLHLEDPERAIPYFQRAVELQPEFEPALANLGMALKSVDELDEALSWLERALTLDPQDVIAWWHRALCEDELRRSEAASSYAQFLRYSDEPAWSEAHAHARTRLAALLE